MKKAIVYTSNSGFTKKYAEMLGEELKIPVYELKEANGKITKEDEIIYMGWIMAGSIKNYKKANQKYNIKTVCAVGMSASNEKQNKEIIEKNQIEEKYFYLQGGFDKIKLKGIYKFMMNSMEKVLKSKIEQKENKTQEEIEMLEMMNKGKDCVKIENLQGILNLEKNQKSI